MTKQCGTCKWFLSGSRECDYPADRLPSCATTWAVEHSDGEDCPVHEYAEEEL